MVDQRNITMAVTGAGGTRVARKVLSWLVRDDRVGHVDLIVSAAGAQLLAQENGDDGHDVVSWLLGEPSGQVTAWDPDDLAAAPTSGSYPSWGMLVVPCALGVVGRIAQGHPVFESLYLGMPWTEVDYLIGPATCVPLYQQLRRDFPEVQAVNAMYTHGLMAIVSTKKRYGGFAKDVGMRTMTTPHGLGYCKIVIVVDENVNPFDLPQVMWALITKVNPAGDLIRLPNLSVVELDPGSQPAGITDKLIIDATTPVEADARGHYGQPVTDLPETAEWVQKLRTLKEKT